MNSRVSGNEVQSAKQDEVSLAALSDFNPEEKEHLIRPGSANSNQSGFTF
jgi:hypothetical protein